MEHCIFTCCPQAGEWNRIAQDMRMILASVAIGRLFGRHSFLTTDAIWMQR